LQKKFLSCGVVSLLYNTNYGIYGDCLTLKGKQNHYNVKLLRGYGVSINLKDNKIILKNGQNDITGESEKEEWFVTQTPYEKIVISGRDYVSSKQYALYYLVPADH